MAFDRVVLSVSAAACFTVAAMSCGPSALAGTWQNESSCSPGYHKESGTDGGIPYVTCVPNGGGGGGGVYIDPGPSPEELALRSVRPRYVKIIESVSQTLPFLDAHSWLSDLPATPQQFVTDTDNMHRILTERTASLNAEIAAYKQTLDLLQQWTSRIGRGCKPCRMSCPLWRRSCTKRKPMALGTNARSTI